MVRLLEQGGLEDFAVFHMEGHWDHDGTQMVKAVRRALGDAPLPLRRMPWLLMRLAAPFVPLFRELHEMKYLWEQPVRMTNERLAAALACEPRTPLDEAVRATLIGLGCMEEKGS